MSPVTSLRCATYMCPSNPIEYFETLLHYLEEKLDIETSLMYESRWDGPPKTGRKDPFEHDLLDLAFVSCKSYFDLMERKNKFIQLLPLASIHAHPKGEDLPGYFCEVIAHRHCRDRVKEVLDLRGCKWAVNSPESLSGNIIPLLNLKQMGENASFFGHVLRSGSHSNSIQMVLNRKVDAASVDSNCLAAYLDKHSSAKSELHRVATWGPLPPYPILVNSRMNDDFKAQIVAALTTMHQDPVWGSKLNRFHVKKFGETSPDVYLKLWETLKAAPNCSLATVYY